MMTQCGEDKVLPEVCWRERAGDASGLTPSAPAILGAQGSWPQLLPVPSDAAGQEAGMSPGSSPAAGFAVWVTEAGLLLLFTRKKIYRF